MDSGETLQGRREIPGSLACHQSTIVLKYKEDVYGIAGPTLFSLNFLLQGQVGQTAMPGHGQFLGGNSKIVGLEICSTG